MMLSCACQRGPCCSGWCGCVGQRGACVRREPHVKLGFCDSKLWCTQAHVTSMACIPKKGCLSYSRSSSSTTCHSVLLHVSGQPGSPACEWAAWRAPNTGCTSQCTVDSRPQQGWHCVSRPAQEPSSLVQLRRPQPLSLLAQLQRPNVFSQPQPAGGSLANCLLKHGNCCQFQKPASSPSDGDTLPQQAVNNHCTQAAPTATSLESHFLPSPCLCTALATSRKRSRRSSAPVWLPAAASRSAQAWYRGGCW